MQAASALDVENLRFAYATRVALQGVSFTVAPGELFAIVGPNGGGKTTLFRLLSTLLPIREGQVTICGHSLCGALEPIRMLLGIVFQSPSLDKKLTVDENLAQQAALYGMSRRELVARADDLLAQLGLIQRRHERVETLSGGLRRRVDLAKGMLHDPKLLLLDEPTTGLDPGARRDLWRYLQQIRQEGGRTVVVTTHLLEEAERADRVAILDEGKIAAIGTPAELKESLGGHTISLLAPQADHVEQVLRKLFPGCQLQRLGSHLRLACPDGRAAVERIMDQLGDQIESISLSRPTLEDVFVAKTGHQYWQAA